MNAMEGYEGAALCTAKYYKLRVVQVLDIKVGYRHYINWSWFPNYLYFLARLKEPIRC